MEKFDSKIEFSGLVDTRSAVYTSFDDKYRAIRVKHPNNDVLYGPYNSVDEAFNALSERNKYGINSLVVGKTVGVVIDGRIVEYWFNERCEKKEDLVPKSFDNHAVKIARVVDKVLELGIID